MVGQDFQTLRGLQPLDESAAAAQLVRIIRDTRNQHTAKPHRLAVVGEPARHLQNIGIRVPRQAAESRVIRVLEVEHPEVRVPHQLTECFVKRLLRGEQRPRRVQGSMPLFRQTEKFFDELRLHRRLTAAHGYTAVVLPIIVVTPRTLKEFFGCPLRAIPLQAHMSGLWQNLQRKWQPCANTTKRTPGASASPKVSNLAILPILEDWRFIIY